jgi:hypothetical protein
MTLKREFLILVFLIINTNVFSQTIITDRPDQTESSSTLLKESLQIESGILFGSTKDNSFSEEMFLAPTVLWRYGIAKGIELRLLTEFASVKDKITSEAISGFNDLQIGTKIKLLKKEGVNTEIALLSHAIIPTAKDELSLNKLGTINKLSISHELSEEIGLGYNIGYDYFGFGSGNLTYSLAVGIAISDKIGFYVEPYGGIVEFEHHISNFDAGFTYLIEDNSQLDVSFGSGINQKMTYLSIGYSLNISKKSND